MKIILSIIFTLIFGVCIHAQSQIENCDCSADIHFLNEKIRETPAFKLNKDKYEKKLNEVLERLTSSTSVYSCFELMNHLIVPLNDSHIGIYGNVPDSLHNSLPQFPRVNYNLDSLKIALQDKPFESLEGIYQNKDNFLIGLLYDEEKAIYQAIILETTSKIWEKGEILYRYIPLQNNFLFAYGGQYSNKRLISYKERIHNGVILSLRLQKNINYKTYLKSPYPDDTYLFKEISPNIDYIKIGSFNSFQPVLGEAEAFYKSLEGKLNKEHLILDLRDNNGGGDRNSDILFKQLNKYLKKNKIYVIANHHTKSNAEQFVVKLKKHKNVFFLGDRTSGSLAYEIKNSPYTLPCSEFIAVLTSKVHKEFLPFEMEGVIPHYFLNYDTSWIDQVEEFINNDAKAHRAENPAINN